MNTFFRSTLILTLAAGTGFAAAQSIASFYWKPPSDNHIVGLGTTVTLELWAKPNGNAIANVSGFEAVVTWDKNMLGFQTYQSVAQPNNSFIEGKGNGDVNMFDFNPTFSIPAEGTHLGNLVFKTLSSGVSFVRMEASATIQSPSGDFGGQTIVYRLDSDGGNFIPDFSSVGKISAVVPEPGTLLALGGSLALLLRRRR